MRTDVRKGLSDKTLRITTNDQWNAVVKAAADKDTSSRVSVSNKVRGGVATSKLGDKFPDLTN